MKLFFVLFLISLNLFAQDTILIDVREQDEVAQGMLKNAQWIPLSKLDEKKITELKAQYKDKKIEVYCRSGGRAGKFISLLGFPEARATNLGGYEALKAKGHSK
jgi:rhodanese-related sulfurtransferase